MSSKENLCVGILLDHEASIGSRKADLDQYLREVAATCTCFKNINIRRRLINNNLHLKFLLEEWIKHEKMDLIISVGNFNFLLQNLLIKGSPDDFKQYPLIHKFLFQDVENAKFRCLISSQTLIILLSSLDNLEPFVEEMPTILSTLNEFKLSISPFSFVNSEIFKKRNELKSKVIPIKVAERPRQSIFPMLSVSDALRCVLNESKTMKTTWKNFEDSLSYVLAEDVIATEPYPPFNASIKDGYAVLADDPSALKDVIGVVTPGCELDFKLRHGTCVRVSTGSALPSKSDAVIQVEDTVVVEKDLEGNELKIKILKPVKQNQDIRSVGSDVSAGEVLIQSKRKITAAEVGAIAVCGIQNVLVYKKPCVALLSTGDEVLETFVPLKPGCIRDSNKSCLKCLLNENSIPFVDIGIAKDTADHIKSHLTEAMISADIIISTGSVSMGEKDLLKLVLEKDFEAKIHFGRVHMKPGKPTTFSTVIYNNEEKLVFSLPGNPVSAFVCFFLFVIPCIKKQMGYQEPEHKIIKVKIAHDIKLDERSEFYRVFLKPGEDSTFVAYSTGSQQSSRLLSMQNADAVLVLPPKTTDLLELKAGFIVDAILLKSM